MGLRGLDAPPEQGVLRGVARREKGPVPLFMIKNKGLHGHFSSLPRVSGSCLTQSTTTSAATAFCTSFFAHRDGLKGLMFQLTSL